MEGDSLRVNISMFWTRPIAVGVCKVIKNSNLTPEKNQHQKDTIFGYVDLSYTIQEAHMSQDQFLHPCQKIEFLGMESDSIKMTLLSTTAKIQKIVQTCQNLLRSHSTTFLELTKVIILLSSTIQAVDRAKI